MERHGHLQVDDGLRTQLLAMSASTIDRQLELVRGRARGGRKQRSSKTNRVRKLVAIRTFADWEEQLGPGYLEVDLVTHSGPSAEGSFVHIGADRHSLDLDGVRRITRSRTNAHCGSH